MPFARRFRLLAAALAAVLLLAAVFPAVAQEEASPIAVVFYEEGCPSCAALDELLLALAPDLPESAIRRYEITAEGSFELLESLSAAYDVVVETIPAVFIGDQVVLGSDRAAEFALRAAVGECATVGCPSPFDRIRPAEFPWRDVLTLGGLVALFLLLLVLQPL
jgi:glutaredoxin